MDNELWCLSDLARALTARTNKQFTVGDVSRGLKELGFKLVRVTNRAAERDEAKLALLVVRMRNYRREQLVFLDEVATVSRGCLPAATSAHLSLHVVV